MTEKGEVLLKNSSLLSDKLISKINEYLEYEVSEKVRAVVLSGEEKLKAKSCAAIELCSDYIIEGFSTAHTDVEAEHLILSDYIIIHTAAIKMAPLPLVNALKPVRKFNKKAFVIIDKWNMLPQTKENCEKIKNSAIEEFSMVRVAGVYNIGANGLPDFAPIESIYEKICHVIADDYAQNKKRQVEILYSHFLDAVHQEYLYAKNKANEVRKSLELYSDNVSGFHRANAVKIKSISSELNMYSKDLYDKWTLITAEECIGDMECDEREILRKHIQDEYLRRVLSDFNELTNIIKDNYEKRFSVLRENILVEMYQIRDRIEGLQYLDSRITADFERHIEELNSIDAMMAQINELLEKNMTQLEKKVQIIARTVFEEETIGRKLTNKIEDLVKQFGPETEKNSSGELVRKEVVIRKYYKNVIEKCNIALFTEADIFVDVLKTNIGKMSEKILDQYYFRLEKCFSELETAVEKEYIVI